MFKVKRHMRDKLNSIAPQNVVEHRKKDISKMKKLIIENLKDSNDSLFWNLLVNYSKSNHVKDKDAKLKELMDTYMDFDKNRINSFELDTEYKDRTFANSSSYLVYLKYCHNVLSQNISQRGKKGSDYVSMKLKSKTVYKILSHLVNKTKYCWMGLLDLFCDEKSYSKLKEMISMIYIDIKMLKEVSTESQKWDKNMGGSKKTSKDEKTKKNNNLFVGKLSVCPVEYKEYKLVNFFYVCTFRDNPKIITQENYEIFRKTIFQNALGLLNTDIIKAEDDAQFVKKTIEHVFKKLYKKEGNMNHFKELVIRFNRTEKQLTDVKYTYRINKTKYIHEAPLRIRVKLHDKIKKENFDQKDYSGGYTKIDYAFAYRADGVEDCFLIWNSSKSRWQFSSTYPEYKETVLAIDKAKGNENLRELPAFDHFEVISTPTLERQHMIKKCCANDFIDYCMIFEDQTKEGDKYLITSSDNLEIITDMVFSSNVAKNMRRYIKVIANSKINPTKKKEFF